MESNQPAARRKRKIATPEDEEEEETYSQTQSQPSSQSAKKRKTKDVLQDAQERDKLVGDLVRYALFMNTKKLPLKREDINKNIMKEHKGALNQVLELAKKKLKAIFGFELVEVSKSKNTKGTLLFCCLFTP
jgi:hypothetical protein